LVEAPVSPMKTSFAGSSSAWAAAQALRRDVGSRLLASVRHRLTTVTVLLLALV